jgi:FAD:protein FMN transferase
MPTFLNRRSFIQGLGILSAGWAMTGWAKPLTTDRFSSTLFKVTETRNLMGTFVTITLFHSSPGKGQTVLVTAFKQMENLIQIFDRHDNGSPLSYLNERGFLNRPPLELVQLLQRARGIHSWTGGVFDPTIKPVLDLYEAEAERGLGRLPSTPDIKEALSLVDSGGLEISTQKIAFCKEGMGITLDGMAKGTIVDATLSFLQRSGVRHALVDAGGDLRVMGGRSVGRPWRIAVYDPNNGNSPAGVISLSEGAIATSGNYMVYFDQEKVHHHILSPVSGVSPLFSVSSTVLAPSAEEADALATSLMLLNPEEGLSLVNQDKRLSAMLISRDGKKGHSWRWPNYSLTMDGEGKNE